MDKKIIPSVGTQIRQRREEKGLSRTEASYPIGRTSVWLKYIEDDERLPKRFDRANLEKLLDFKIEEPTVCVK